MKQTLHLIRHGQIDSNVTGAIDTAVPGPPLNALGLRQAQTLVATMAEVPIDAIYASTATRAQMTAQPLAQARGLDVQVRDGLKEISAGTLEMSEQPRDRATYHEVITSWLLGDLNAPLGGGTNGHEVLARFGAVVDEIRALGPDHTAIVAHGAVILFWSAMRSPNLTGVIIEKHPPLNTGVVTLAPASAKPLKVPLVGGNSAIGVRSDWHARSWMGVDL